jgi:hypothetical protein
MSTVNDDTTDWLDAEVDTTGMCRCDECQTYFNDDVVRPIIQVKSEDYTRAVEIFNSFEAKDRRSRYHPCKRHHYVELTSTPDESKGPIICKVEYCRVHELHDEHGLDCIMMNYRYPNCQIKYDFILKPDNTFSLYARGLCRDK